MAFLLAQHEQVKAFYLLASPVRLAQELQAGGDARIVCEAPDWDTGSQIIPAIKIDQLGDDVFQRQAMQRIARLCLR